MRFFAALCKTNCHNPLLARTVEVAVTRKEGADALGKAVSVLQREMTKDGIIQRVRDNRRMIVPTRRREMKQHRESIGIYKRGMHARREFYEISKLAAR
eukprot:m.117709 g.117709  ORF g.117709 m.117709 type:complete len:99 (-) comp14257_c0_seq2:2371-2667(-)